MPKDASLSCSVDEYAASVSSIVRSPVTYAWIIISSLSTFLISSNLPLQDPTSAHYATFDSQKPLSQTSSTNSTRSIQAHQDAFLKLCYCCCRDRSHARSLSNCPGYNRYIQRRRYHHCHSGGLQVGLCMSPHSQSHRKRNQRGDVYMLTSTSPALRARLQTFHPGRQSYLPSRDLQDHRVQALGLDT